MKPMKQLATLVFGLALVSSGCSSFKPSAAPESEQAEQDYRNRTDTATLQAEDSFWEFLDIPIRALWPSSQ
jgi:hypothetical protein